MHNRDIARLPSNFDCVVAKKLPIFTFRQKNPTGQSYPPFADICGASYTNIENLLPYTFSEVPYTLTGEI
jgi:hypothetical protein